MVKEKKIKVLVAGTAAPTIQGGLKIMARGLKNWRDAVNPPPKKSSEPSRRERSVFPPPHCY